MIATLILDDIVILKKKTGFAVLLWVVVIIVRASLTVRITVKNGNLPEDHKIWEIRFFTVKGLINRKKNKIFGYICPGLIWCVKICALLRSQGQL